MTQDEFKEGQYWDTAQPYHYVRHEEHPQGHILIVGGEDHKTGIKPSEYEVLVFSSWFAQICGVPGQEHRRVSKTASQPAPGEYTAIKTEQLHKDRH
jgi:hypothetical protein